jgi:translation initiation factor IF-3
VPNAEPPVCKVIDYGKFRFEEQKKQSAAKKKQHTTSLKEITLRPGTEEHDYQVKLKKIRQFIEKGDKVKVTIRFRGRELANQGLGMSQLKRIIDDMSETAKVDNNPRMEGRQMNMLLSPESKK